MIVGFSVHQTPGDAGCLIPHLAQQRWPKGQKPRNVCADAAYGSKENNADLQKNGHCFFAWEKEERGRKFRLYLA